MKHVSRIAFSRVAPLLFLYCSPLASAHATVGTARAVPPPIRAAGLAERIGDIMISCSGVPNTTLTGNFTVALATNISNRISSGNALSGIVFTVNSGAGPQAVVTAPLLLNRNTLVFNGVPFTFSAQGSVSFLIAGIRANASGVPAGNQIIASLGVNAAGLPLMAAQVVV